MQPAQIFVEILLQAPRNRFAIPGDSFLGIPPCFPRLGFTLIFRSQGTTFSPVGGLLLFSFLGELHIFLVVVIKRGGLCFTMVQIDIFDSIPFNTGLVLFRLLHNTNHESIWDFHHISGNVFFTNSNSYFP